MCYKIICAVMIPMVIVCAKVCDIGHLPKENLCGRCSHSTKTNKIRYTK